MRERKKGLRLLPPAALIKTGDVDHADWNFRPLLGTISRARYKLVLSMLSGRRFARLLEVGYGSGVFMPELARHCHELYGIDIHQNQQKVSEKLSRFNIRASLFSGCASKMPFRENFFDGIVAVSSLEFIEELDASCSALKRVLKPNGFLVTVTPSYSPVADLGLKLLTGKSAQQDYDNRRQRLIPTLLKHFKVLEQKTSPLLVSTVLPLYTGLKLSHP